ncbi:uncharacterized protein MELLADRAFT_85381 [Melampsora larici-populina 98AG31]|uniref:Uncharacterized protein n=1 Tax=Melampsora larici-populina (strain 98AG31 / pathotype 3-4-7) TaxID=747676 RepID=F4RIH6_MELLP|nr:uncharacterized protein MELLADRAFT_85381 [Melampsora larici-populina 98AG31]EGG07567.1 hypothetical protein MELLADRAFT_85381 [Melampsora larici-populina 98AG31]
MVEPWMRTIILILKIWRKKSNNPYIDTISLYGYVLLVIYYFVNGLKDGVSPYVLISTHMFPWNTLYSYFHAAFKM